MRIGNELPLTLELTEDIRDSIGRRLACEMGRANDSHDRLPVYNGCVESRIDGILFVLMELGINCDIRHDEEAETYTAVKVFGKTFFPAVPYDWKGERV